MIVLRVSRVTMEFYDHGNPWRGWPMAGRGKKLTEDERDEIVDLYARGMAMRKIALTVGRSYGAVNLVLHRQDEIQVSPRGGYRRPETPVQ